jgi:hypothetical protein
VHLLCGTLRRMLRLALLVAGHARPVCGCVRGGV